MSALLLLLLIASYSKASEYFCPNNVSYFDVNSCDRTTRNQCPCGFGCRPATVVAGNATTYKKFICCETRSMTVAQWFTENDISPQFVPQIPVNLLDSVFVSRNDGKARVAGEEVSMLAQRGLTFGTVASIEFEYQFVPPTGGYLHVLTAIDPSKVPSALFLIYNIPSLQTTIVDLSYPNRQMAVVVGNETVANSDTYRSQYVVLVFQSETMIADPRIDLLSSKGDLSVLLVNSTCSRQLGPPIAGTMLWVTSRSTIFPLTPEVVTPSPWKGASTCAVNVVIAGFVLIVSALL
ncbi:hypothetical protein QR680_000436 [Steinernema hermaphroditum]|uniref:Uncharacterized protein n=1 Tax=Steinernema hermaphroditum TaxID=289476 RepID=A0AA39LE38_9BILA|nr:hypothetical protein QR680_000436 [Steinernema hermaphroditum]